MASGQQAGAHHTYNTMIASLYIGQKVRYNGNEYQVTNYGPWGVRIESGYGREHCILVVPSYELDSVQ